MRTRRTGSPLSIWVIIGALVLGCGLFASILLALWSTKPEVVAATDATAVLTIVAAPTSTPPGSQSLLSTPTPTQEPLAITIDGITLGKYVQISGTGGDGLRLRREPSTSGAILFLGYESEVFKVNDGPVQADNYTWWYLTAPYDDTRSGWAAAQFLKIVDLEPTQ